jgi:hypothetical protein
LERRRWSFGGAAASTEMGEKAEVGEREGRTVAASAAVLQCGGAVLLRCCRMQVLAGPSCDGRRNGRPEMRNREIRVRVVHQEASGASKCTASCVAILPERGAI